MTRRAERLTDPLIEPTANPEQTDYPVQVEVLWVRALVKDALELRIMVPPIRLVRVVVAVAVVSFVDVRIRVLGRTNTPDPREM